MELLAALAGLVLAGIVLVDVFVALVLPATVTWRIRASRTLYVRLWLAWRAPVHRRGSHRRHATYLRVYGPLSLFFLLAVWSVGLILAFGLVYWSLGPALKNQEGATTFYTDLYVSGTTMFTLGPGDVVPTGPIARALVVVQAGTGLAYLAIVIGYLPVLYQAFSQREIFVTLLSAHAGAPPSAAELLRRYGQDDAVGALRDLLRDSERWVAEVLETHVSHPPLAYYRAQREDQSWLAALTMILDLSALILVGIPDAPVPRARRTFEMAQSAAEELCRVFGRRPRPPAPDRLPDGERQRLRAALAEAGVPLQEGSAADAHLDELRRLYEPYVAALGDYFLLALPPWVPLEHVRQRSRQAEAIAQEAHVTAAAPARGEAG
jgi:hypothetical protein